MATAATTRFEFEAHPARFPYPQPAKHYFHRARHSLTPNVASRLAPNHAETLDNPSFNSTEIAMKITIKVNVNEKVHPLLKQSTATEAAVTI